jgi:outer membrane protein TolC
MIKHGPSLLLTAGLLVFRIHAAPVITPGEAVKIALEKNYGIRIAATAAQIATVNNNAGNAGMLPLASLTGNDAVSVARPPLGDGSPYVNRKTTNTLTLQAGIDWTIFDGGKMFVTRKKLSEIEAAGIIAYRAATVQTVADVISAYYGIVQQQQQIVFTDEVIGYDREQMSIAHTGFTTGHLSRQAVLQATIDLNEDVQRSISSRTALTAKKRELNRLLCRDPETLFDVVDSIAVDSLPQRQRLLAAVDSGNTSIAYLKKQVEIASLTLKENRSLLFPTLTVGAGYAFRHTGSDFGKGSDIENSRYYGPQIETGISLPLYRGGLTTNKIKTSRLLVGSAHLQLENTREAIRVQLLNVIDDYDNQLKLLEIENENVILTKENLDISLQRYKLGQSTYLEFRQAQESYENAKTRLINIRYSMKIAETQVKLLLAKM